ncbi:MAG: glycosyltransferase, partial [Nitrospiraceae bacterium]
MTTNAFGTLARQEQCEKTPRVAVLCHVYNGEQYLDEMIQSVLTQTFTEFEFLILDDGSTDRTKAIVGQYQQDRRLRYVYQDNIGRSGNAFHTILNRCVAHTTAELLCFIGADDVFLPQKLAIQVSRFDQDRSVDLVFSDGYHINAQGRILASDFHFDEALTFTRRSLLRTLFSKNIVAHPTVMVTRRAVERLGGFETGFCPDYQFWLKASRQLHFAYIADKLIKYRVHVQGVSTGRNNKTTPETVRLLADTRVRYTIDDLYPEIADCHDQALARYSAHLHFGNVLMTANIPVPRLALAEYRDALAAKPNGVAALNNAAIALTMLGDTKQIATCLALMRVHGGHVSTVQKNLLALQQRMHIGCVLFC